ncbi:hypothetical protein HRI_003385400 [Hibiscus trionum]|uniref:Uncharacterized protein n=1 Tax=Hibiscus trionum TaxID=183268 RepID=A0A9W7MDZ1_HIBTR|nr:hypothetical protein HRI_003385400 [Hibiscus trionum]
MDLVNFMILCICSNQLPLPRRINHRMFTIQLMDALLKIVSRQETIQTMIDFEKLFEVKIRFVHQKINTVEQTMQKKTYTHWCQTKEVFIPLTF